MINSKECVVAGRTLKIETGKLANQADSSVTIHYGDTILLVTTCVGGEGQDDVDFVRLTVDYEERHYAIGKIPGSFIRREARPSEAATLTARLTDRSLRPLISKGMCNEVQIVITVLSTEQENSPDILALIGASASLTLSSVPFNGPVAAVRMGYIDGQYVINPTLAQLYDSEIDVVVASTKQKVVMVEAEGKEAPEDLFLEAIRIGHETNQDMIRIQEELQQICGNQKMPLKVSETSPDLVNAVSEFNEKIEKAITSNDKVDRGELVDALKCEIIDKLKETFPEAVIEKIVEEKLKKSARKFMLSNKIHLDGRQKTEIRPLSSEVGILPRTHGSALFTRGRTQVLNITTLGSLRQEQLIDGLGLEEKKRFMHHYNFPAFSTGEVKRSGSPGRREIGHGALAERALFQVIPDEKEFSYTIRLVSEVLSSNGSTSMASVCASSLSLMDAGVPIKAPVAGIAMGLVTGDTDDDYLVLTDIEGQEDFYGDMDFKVAGTVKGITAIQLDIKLQGISQKIIKDAIWQARDARMFILDNMNKAITASRSELSPYAPRIYKLTIPQDKIGTVIGPGGKTIRSITEETKATVDIEDDGTIIIGSHNEESARKAIDMIEGLTREVEVGAIYTGKVTRVTNFGAFVEILPKKEGLVHISELADYRVAKVEDVVKEGDEITVKVTEIDHLGRINLSRKAVFEDSNREKDSTLEGSGSTNREFNKPMRSRPGVHPRTSKDIRHRPHINK